MPYGHNCHPTPTGRIGEARRKTVTAGSTCDSSLIGDGIFAQLRSIPPFAMIDPIGTRSAIRTAYVPAIGPDRDVVSAVVVVDD